MKMYEKSLSRCYTYHIGNHLSDPFILYKLYFENKCYSWCQVGKLQKNQFIFL